MPLIIEDGSCIDGATSYVSLEEADAYLVPRQLWESTAAEVEADAAGQAENTATAAKEAALMRAFDFLNGPLDWKGQKVSWEREAAWPRFNVPIPGTDPVRPEYIPDDVVPGAVKRAQMELAAIIHGGKDLLTPQERGGAVIAESESTSKSVESIEKSTSHSVTYAEGAPVEDWLPSVFPLLKPFLNSVPGQTENYFNMIKVVKG